MHAGVSDEYCSAFEDQVIDRVMSLVVSRSLSQFLTVSRCLSQCTVCQIGTSTLTVFPTPSSTGSDSILLTETVSSARDACVYIYKMCER